jgi:hypothetical protein
VADSSIASNRSGRVSANSYQALATASVRAFGFVQMDGPQLAESRRRPGPVPPGWSQLAPTLLKASDEQTVAGVCAVLSAITEQGGASPAEYVGWGAVVASRFLGRSQLVNALQKFHDEGVWGVSPHLIPHYALHSPSGTLSLALGLKGPNLGIGGGADAAIQGFLTALSWLDEGSLEGVWLVLTGHTPEFVPGPSGLATTDSRCEALALALVPDQPGRPRLRIVADDANTARLRVNLADLHGRLVDNRSLGVGSAPSTTRINRPHIRPRPSSRTIASDPTMGLRLELDIDAREGGR